MTRKKGASSLLYLYLLNADKTCEVMFMFEEVSIIPLEASNIMS